ncbi:MAG: chitobiase/beta-hexosaminidase C-terminal domain-containing protein [Prevotella sp.]|nr:chitobiase/beta-hexosaminidase C-terminal domain-containing protein [Prevotella sp.]
MKRIIQILLLCLVATTAVAQSTATRRLRITTQPRGMFFVTLKVYPTAELKGYDSFMGDPIITMKSDTTGIDVQVPVEAGIYMTVGFDGYNRPNINNYVLESWTDNGEPVLLRQKGFNFLWMMPDHDADLVGTFVFNPAAPGQDEQPMMGCWDPETGTIINDAESDSPQGLSGVDRSKVLRYIRVGNYWGASKKKLSFSVSPYPNCTFFDASRTDAPRVEITYSGSEPCALTDVVLPATITSIERLDFWDVPLQTLTLYALTPPDMSFTNCPDMIVRVPAEAVPIYQAHPQWSSFTIVAMDADYVNLGVQFMATPDSATLAHYKGMSLVLTNKTSGQTRRYVLNGQLNEYEFRYLTTRSTYKVQLLNYRDEVVAEMDNIYLGEDSKTVTFDHLRRPHQLVVSVSDGTATIGETHYEVTWRNGNGEYLKKGNELDNVLEEERVSYELHLDNSLAMHYQTPAEAAIVVGEQPDRIEVTLHPIPLTTVTVSAVDSVAHHVIDGATIIVKQRLDYAETGATVTLTTGADGKAQGQALATMSHVSVTSPSHGTREFNANLADSTDFRVMFAPANGTTIRLVPTWQAALDEGETASNEPNLAGLNYELKATLPDGTEMALTDYIVNFPVYTLYNRLPAGTKLMVTAAGANIDSVAVEAMVGDGNVSIALPLVERGKLHVQYAKSDSRHPAVLLFNNTTGELVKKLGFGDYMSVDIKNLPAGNYFVAAMNSGPAYQLINSKSQLMQYSEEKDYVGREVTLQNGQVSKVLFNKVPLSTTQIKSNLATRRAQWDKSNTFYGYHTNINIKVDFEGLQERVYRPDWNTYYDHSKYPTDCKIEVYLPEGLSQIMASRSYRMYTSTGYLWRDAAGHSQMGGDIETLLSTSSSRFSIDHSDIKMATAHSVWDKNERKLTVDWPHIDEGGKMFITTMGLQEGTFTPEVYLTYTLNGKQYREVLETNTLTVNMCDIKVPEVVVKPRFRVSGNAEYTGENLMMAMTVPNPHPGDEFDKYYRKYQTIPYEGITIMDGSQPIGKASVNSSGTWEAWVTLPDATPLSRHNIYAQIKPHKDQPLTYNTEVKEVVYDPNSVVPISTKMTFFNHHPQHLEDVNIVFDYEAGRCTPKSYAFSNQEGYDTDFTFEVNLSNNDTTKVYACAVFIATDGPDAEERVVWAHYNKRKNRWVAYSKFNTRSLPYSVMVEPYYHKDHIGSSADVNKSYDVYDHFLTFDDTERTNLMNRFNQLIDQGYQASLQNNPALAPDPAALSQVMEQLFGLTTGESYTGDDSNSDGNIDNLLNAIESDDDPMKNISSVFDEVKKLNELGDLVEGIVTSEATGLTAEGLLAAGYDELKLDDGTSVFILTQEDGSWTYVDLAKNLKMEIPADSKLARMFSAPRNMSVSEEWFWTAVEFVYLSAQDFVDLVGKVSDACSAIIDACQIVINKAVENQKQFLDMVEYNNKHLGWVERGFANLRLKFAYDSMTKTITAAQKVKDSVTKFKLGNGVGTLASFYSLANNYLKFRDQDVRLYDLAKSLQIKDCDDWEKAANLQSQIYSFLMWIIPYQTSTLFGDLAAITTGLASCLGVEVDPSTLTWWGVALSFAKIAVSYAADKIYQDKYDAALEVFNYAKQDIVCDKKKTCQQRGDCPKCVDLGTCPEWPKLPKEPKYPTTTPTIDPSGYVYEGVPSNRLEGVTATLFHKMTAKDIFGEDEEVVGLWDAENYEQLNPQQTNVNGEYGWMVPSGWWQVKYEKAGYQTEYSEWLPVPPPQLDVNQGMRQMTMPVVSDVKATPQAVQVSFDKYMRADSLTTDRIFVTMAGQKVNGTVDLMLPTDEAEALQRLTNRVHFVPTTQLPAGQKLSLTVKGDVVSYAGIEMGSDFQQEFLVKAAVERIVADSAINVLYDQSYSLTLQALPAAAAAGKKVTARMLGDMVATASATELTLDAQGKATITITGEAHGTTALVLQMADDPQVKQVVVVSVREEGDFVCPMPLPNYQPSQAYPEGTQIALTCELPEATIWYTLDGTCPCNPENDVHKYEAPIALTGDMVIKAYATAPKWADSDIAEFTFLLLDPSGIRVVSDALPAKAKGTFTLSGVKIGQTKHLQRGIYIRNGRKFVVK